MPAAPAGVPDLLPFACLLAPRLPSLGLGARGQLVLLNPFPRGPRLSPARRARGQGGRRASLTRTFLRRPPPLPLVFSLLL